LSVEAGLKYFILGSFGSGILLIGISFIYFLTGLLNFYDFKILLENNFLFQNNSLLLFGFLLILISILFKLSFVPFHIWSPDVYYGAPAIVTFFFSLGPKISFIGFLIRFVCIFSFLLNCYLNLLFLFCGILSLVLGSFIVVYQSKLKRLLAYSSITNLGFIGILFFSFNIESLILCSLYFFIYIFALTSIFIIITSIYYFNNFVRIKNIFELFGLFKFNFFFCFFFITNLFSLLGLPPFAGFFSKFFLFISIFELQLFFVLFICFSASIFSAIIYLKMVRLSFFNKYINLLFFVPLSYNVILLIFFNFVFNILFFKYSDSFFYLFFNSLLDNLFIISDAFF